MNQGFLVSILRNKFLKLSEHVGYFVVRGKKLCKPRRREKATVPPFVFAYGFKDLAANADRESKRITQGRGPIPVAGFFSCESESDNCGEVDGYRTTASLKKLSAAFHQKKLSGRRVDGKHFPKILPVSFQNFGGFGDFFLRQPEGSFHRKEIFLGEKFNFPVGRKRFRREKRVNELCSRTYKKESEDTDDSIVGKVEKHNAVRVCRKIGFD